MPPLKTAVTVRERFMLGNHKHSDCEFKSTWNETVSLMFYKKTISKNVQIKKCFTLNKNI